MNFLAVRELASIGLGLFLALTLGCKPASERNGQAHGASNRVFQVQGVVQEVMADRNQVKIQHEKIPDYMEAMTMTFTVRGSNELGQLQPGDEVRFKMFVTPTDGWIDEIVKTGETNAVRPTFRVVRDVELLQEGDLIPEYHFTNELGRPVKLSDYKGKAVALTFIFTRCPYPVYCPRMASNFAAAMQKLQTLPIPSTSWHLLAISFDPEFDTPTVLNAYAKQYAYDPAQWSFLTGDLVEITAIAEQFELMFWRPEPNSPTGISHNLRTVVLDPNGRVHKILRENEWKVDELVSYMVEATRIPVGSE